MLTKICEWDIIMTGSPNPNLKSHRAACPLAAFEHHHRKPIHDAPSRRTICGLVPLLNLLPPHRIKHTQVQRDLVPEPRRPLRVVAQLRLPLELPGPLGGRVRVDQRRQWAPPDDQPGDEGAELRGREEVHLEHGVWVGADGFLPEAVDAELGDCGNGVSCLFYYRLV